MTTITIDPARASEPLRGGIGASWHAINDGPRNDGMGSAWGGHPAPTDTAQWEEIYRHADWLGLNFIRVEIAQRSYQPQRDQFTWESEDMLALRRILDWAQSRGCDVFLQQMNNNVEWNAYPGVDALHSAPHDLAAWADGLAAMAGEVTREWGYSCVKWLCVNNEPEAHFSWWQGYGLQPLGILPGLRAARAALDARGLHDLPLAGPDYTGLDWPEKKVAECLPLVGAVDMHTYLDDFRFLPVGESGPEKLLGKWTALANAAGKPFFLTEIGCMRFGWYSDSPAPGGYAANLANAEIILRGLAAGVEGFNRWSFTNRGDIDGQWQLIDTWDRANDCLLPAFTPHNPAHALFALLTRFFAKGSRTLPVRMENAIYGGWQQYLLAGSLLAPDGELTIWVLASTEQSHPFELRIPGETRPLHRYRITPENVRADSPLRLDPDTAFHPVDGLLADTAPGLSLTAYSTRFLPHDQPVHRQTP